MTEQYSIGGDKSFWNGRRWVKRQADSRVLAGIQISVSIQDFFDTYFSFRYDLGNVWQVTDDIRFKDLRHGIGLTTAFDTPIGEASFSAGRSFIVKNGFNNNSFVFGPYNFYFSIGYDI